MSDFFKIIECECGNQVCHLQSINNLCPDCVKKKLVENQRLREWIEGLIERYEPHRSSSWGVFIFIQDLQKALKGK